MREDLHATAQAQDQVQRGLLLDVVVRERPAILELLAGEDQALLVRRNAFLVLNLRLHVVDRVGRLNVQRDRLAPKRIHLAETSELHRQIVRVELPRTR